MKARSGFVSNSSTSSFIIVVKNSGAEGEDWFGQLEFVVGSLTHGKMDNVKWHAGKISEYRETLMRELEGLQKSKEVCEKELKEFKAIIKNKEARRGAELVLELQSRKKQREFQKEGPEGILQEVTLKQYDSRRKPFNRLVKNELERYDSGLTELSKKIEKLWERLKAVEPYNDKKWKMVSFEEENSWGVGITDAAERLVNMGKAVIVHKEST